jgi:SPP1 family predicted phage head-tail adaptor
MRIGGMVHRITLQSPVAENRKGEPASYIDAKDSFASIAAMKVTEKVSENQQKSIGEFTFTIWHDNAVNENWRIKYRNQIYNIIEVIHDFGFPFLSTTIRAMRQNV